MATISPEVSDADTAFDSGESSSVVNLNLKEMLGPLASLKVSVVLFAAGIFLVLAGTLAQVNQDIWAVVHGYFRCWFAWIDFQVFFPKTWFPDLQNIPGGFWFPGGWTIGGLMAINLLAAHAIRFRVQAKGERLRWGLAVTAIGVFVTWVVIEFGSASNGVFATSDFDWSKYWNWISYGLLIPAVLFGIAASRTAQNKKYRAEFWVCSVLTLLFLWTSLFLIIGGETVMLNNSAMRILWQLIQATLAGSILLGGCLLLFKKRAGIVLLHAGVLLLMANEIVVDQLHEEASMTLFEGDTANFVRDIRSAELAIIDRSDKEKDQHIVVPGSVLKSSAEKKKLISNKQLPVDLLVRKYYPNAEVKQRNKGDDNPSTAGVGVNQSIVPLKTSAGTDSGVNYVAAYVDVLEKGTDKKMGTYLLSAFMDSMGEANKIQVGDKSYEIGIRFKRNYKPYSIHLIDVRKDDYIGTSTPMNYSSEIRLVDKTRGEDRKVKIWMNNPLRYAGETFYQSGYNKVGEKEMTTLQVVTNEGWMIPYVACMIVSIGMLYQFVLTLLRFLNRAASGKLEFTSSDDSDDNKSGYSIPGLVIPLALFCVCGYWLYGLAKVPVVPADEFDYFKFGEIPVVYQGRVKPIDTLARNSMRILCNRETVRLEPVKKTDQKKEAKQPKTIPATQWLLELISSSEIAMDRPVIRIDNDELLSTLNLERRKSHRYSLSEIRGKQEQGKEKSPFEKAAQEANGQRMKSPESLSLYQKKVLELDRKIGLIGLLRASMVPPGIDINAKDMREQMTRAMFRVKQIDQAHPPLLIPPVDSTSEGLEEALKRNEWETYAKAFLFDIIYSVTFKVKENPFSKQFAEIVNAYSDNKPATFNKAVGRYQALLNKTKIEKLEMSKIEFEARFNKFSPLFWPAFLYLFAFVLAIFGWLLPSAMSVLNRSAFVLIVLTFCVHSWALWARIEISGRPPVTNLYSSAVFIGWAGVLCGLILELLFKRGIGIVLATVAGFASLWIAHGLAGDGDTFVVLQAVLDTQFWLSTHVVCITLGYAATFIAGILGLIYISMKNPLALIGVAIAVAAAVGLQQVDGMPVALRVIVPLLFVLAPLLTSMFMPGITTVQMPKEIEKAFERMIYGTLCFALWFSFVGTVLGGLWADDSWGRFWGWDPKENGALIIVLWVALVLHARWDRLVKTRGLAMLAVAGNITTAWSWFGVNELGVGLHSYGFTEGVLFYLSLFVLSQIAMIILGILASSKEPDPAL